MSVSFPLAWPSGVGGVASCSLRQNVVAADSRSPFTGVGQVFTWPGEWWEAEVTLPPMERDRAEVWLAWIASLRGMTGTFLFGNPFAAMPRGVATGTPLVNGAGQTGPVLALDGATASVTGWLKAGDYIQLGAAGTARLHKVLADASSNASGQVTLDIWPSIVSAPADNAPIVVSSARGLFRLVSNAQGHEVTAAQHYGLTFAMRSEA